MEEFDPVLVYVAIADFEAVEDSSISLTAGQCVEVRRSCDYMVIYCHSVPIIIYTDANFCTSLIFKYFLFSKYLHSSEWYRSIL